MALFHYPPKWNQLKYFICLYILKIFKKLMPYIHIRRFFSGLKMSGMLDLFPLMSPAINKP